MRQIGKWRAATALFACATLGWVGFSALAQQSGKLVPGDIARAREMAALIEQGQLNLPQATDLAEKHVKGTALDVECDIHMAAPDGPDVSRPVNPPVEKVPPVANRQRLIYEVSCFAGETLHTVRVDGLSKRVIDAPPPGKDHGTLDRPKLPEREHTGP